MVFAIIINLDKKIELNNQNKRPIFWGVKTKRKQMRDKDNMINT